MANNKVHTVFVIHQTRLDSRLSHFHCNISYLCSNISILDLRLKAKVINFGILRDRKRYFFKCQTLIRNKNTHTVCMTLLRYTKTHIVTGLFHLVWRNEITGRACGSALNMCTVHGHALPDVCGFPFLVEQNFSTLED